MVHLVVLESSRINRSDIDYLQTLLRAVRLFKPLCFLQPVDIIWLYNMVVLVHSDSEYVNDCDSTASDPRV